MTTSARRALGMLLRAGPVAAPLFVAVRVVSGAVPYLVIALGARLVGLAPELAGSADARRTATVVMVWFGVASVAARCADVVADLASTYLGFQLDAVFEADRIAALAALPGLEHFDSKEHAERLHLAGRSQQAPRIALTTAGFAIQHGAAGAGSLVLLGRLGWWAPALVVAASLPVAVSGWRHAGRRVGVSRMASSDMLYALYHWALPLRTAREVRLFGFIDWLRTRQAELWGRAITPYLAETRHEHRVRAALTLVKVVALGVPIAVAIQEFAAGSLDVGTATAVVIAGATVGPYLHYFETQVGYLREEIAFLPEAFAIADLPRTDPRLDMTGHRQAPTALRHGIAFHGVAFRYPGDGRWVLRDFSAELPAGESAALVGVNGAGKSTLVKLLCRMYDPREGRITLDGVDLREYDLADLRRRFAVLTQDFLRLPASLLDNVAVGALAAVGEVDVEAMREAMAEAGATAVAERLPAGQATILAADLGGVELSGGEWQRVAMARLLAARRARGASILVMDEPTASLDVRLEHELFEGFSSITAGATTLLISHRFSTVRMADRMLVLAGGRVAEQGTHDELLAAGGTYARLYGLQAARFAAEDEP